MVVSGFKYYGFTYMGGNDLMAGLIPVLKMYFRFCVSDDTSRISSLQLPIWNIIEVMLSETVASLYTHSLPGFFYFPYYIS